MKVPFLDLRRDYEPLRETILARIQQVVDSQIFIMGPEVMGFEEALASYTGVAHAIGVSSGSDALLATLMAMGVGPGDEVIAPAFTFFATAGAVARLGARPVFVDIDPTSFLLDPKATLERVGPRTKAVIPVHLYGRTFADAEVEESLKREGIAMLGDAAQAIGAIDGGGRPAGAIGTAAAFSFFPAKNVGAFGDAGAITTDDDELAERIRVIRLHGARPKYIHHVVGGNFRLDALQAAVLSVKLETVEALTLARGANAARYAELFAATGLVSRGQVVLPEAGPGRHCYHQYVIRVHERDALRSYLGEQGIGTMVYYPQPLHLQACFADLGYGPGDLPHTEQATEEVLALPIFPGLTDEESAYVVDRIAAFYRTR